MDRSVSYLHDKTDQLCDNYLYISLLNKIMLAVRSSSNIKKFIFDTHEENLAERNILITDTILTLKLV